MIEAHPLNTAVRLPEELARLRELALNLRWTWDRGARALFRRIYPELWDQIVDNPWLVLQSASPRRLQALTLDPEFLGLLDVEQARLQLYMAERGWFHQDHPEEGETVIAYFTAECGLTEAVPVYAGGLGILSGDHLKAASALGVPLVGVSLLYQQGYSRQMLDASGWQLDRFPANSFADMPLQVERNADGLPLTVSVPLPGRPLSLLVWRAQVGRVTLYLLDANIPINSPSDRGITGELYGGDREMRLQQEMALGIGGWRALTALGLRPQVCHLNEGHAAFALLERARSLMVEARCSFWEALAATAAGNVFTTHTPVPAGFDLFPPDMLARYFAPYAAELGISIGDLIGLGRIDPRNPGEPFNMAVLALRHVNSCNGVSKLHAEVSRRLFRGWFPRFPDREIPITAVTNGIHTASWSAECDEVMLLEPYLGPDAAEYPDRVDWDRVADIPDGTLWDCLKPANVIGCRNAGQAPVADAFRAPPLGQQMREIRGRCRQQPGPEDAVDDDEDQHQRITGGHAVADRTEEDDAARDDQRAPAADVVGQRAGERSGYRRGVGQQAQEEPRRERAAAELQDAKRRGRQQLKRGEKHRERETAHDEEARRE